MVHCILSNANTVLSPVIEVFSSPSSDIEPSPSPMGFVFKFVNMLNIALADLDSIANNHGENVTSFIKHGNTGMIDSGDGGGNFSFSSLTDFILVNTEMLDFISPIALMIIGPLTVITLTYIMADNKYYLFATVFAPMVDRALLSIRSLFAPAASNQQEWQHRTISDDGETSASEGVLWGMILLFCLESLLVGSIVVLIVLIIFLLTILASLSTVLSPRDNPALLEETTKILIVFLFSWVSCVVTTNVLRMVLYHTIDDDD